MDTHLQFDSLASASFRVFSNGCILVVSLAAGCALAFVITSPRTFLMPALGCAAVALFLIYPELALAAYVVVGDVKGNESVASLLPVDLTLAMGAILLGGIALNLLRGRQPLRLPAAYFLFIVLLAMMAASLNYTPVFDAGLDKFARFLSVTGIVIVAPFLVLNTFRAINRFLIGFGVATFAICAWSLSSLGGNQRLVSPSDNTIGLGHIACALFVLVWVGIVCRYSFPRRALAYPLLAIPALALVGSASRGSVIACMLVVVISLFVNRRLLLDVAGLTVIGVAAFPVVGIPGPSISYLSTLLRSQSFGGLLNFRSDLLSYGWSLLQDHPLFGAGLAGFRYLSPNPTLYKWPHNIFLEIACELGIPAALVVIAIFGSAIREAIRQLQNRMAPYMPLSQIAAALLLVGLINAVNTGNINSDRSTWLFVSLVFAAGALRSNQKSRAQILVSALVES
ncbi:MAG: O-antigen ligase family protein [Candidatus Acidiferrales bacterium]